MGHDGGWWVGVVGGEMEVLLSLATLMLGLAALPVVPEQLCALWACMLGCVCPWPGCVWGCCCAVVLWACS